jgi:integrating conjugative element protein (TIGR03749 family)
LLRVQTVWSTSYVTALAPFSRTRVVAEDRATGSVILLDLTASRSNSVTQPIQIVVPATAAAGPAASDDEGGAAPVDMVTLTRFAAQQMYAPRRLTGPHSAIRRVMVERAQLDDLYAGGGVRGTPAAQWRGDEFYVTAVVLQNLQGQPVELDPLNVRGRWRAITFQHGRLLGKGSEADTTVVYLVCDRPFDACR